MDGDGVSSRLPLQLDYWREKLGGELPILDIPKDRPRIAASAARDARRISFDLSADAIRRAQELAGSERTTLFVVLLAAYKVLLLRLTRQNDLVVGTFTAARGAAAPGSASSDRRVAMRTHLDAASSFREAVRRVHATVLEANARAVAFDRVAEAIRVPQDLSFHPIFQTQFTLNPPAEAAGSGAVDCSDAPMCDLTLSVTENAAGASGFMAYAPNLFDADTIARYADMYVRLLVAMVSEPENPVRRLGLVCAEEKQRILYGLNGYARPEHRYRTMAEPFEEQVARTPEAVALVDDEGSLTYAALNERANRLAHFLRRRGAGRGVFVAICMERSAALIVALYGIAKSGAAYVPLDSELPSARIGFMLEDTRPRLVLVDSAAKAKIPAGPWQVVTMDQDGDQWAGMPASNISCDDPAHHLVYLLYTSGSTGRPKAVAYPVDGAIADILWLQRSYPFRLGDANVFKTSYGFDVSIWEIFWTLYFGAKLVVCRPGGHRDPAYLAKVIDQHRVTMIFLAPSMLQVFLDKLPADSGGSLRWVICGGEPITPRLRDTFYARLGARLINGYGPTEAGTVTDMILPPDTGSPIVPLGRPAANFRLYVLDEELEVAPIGVPGEAYIAGEVGLAHCYHGRPDLTAERFLPDPFGSPGGRMYRTGDICRYRNDGVLEHLGRAGRQIKLRGMRIELAEIEAVICEHRQVEGCSALVVGEKAEQRVVAFVVARGAVPVDPRELTEHAGRFLPSFMVPAAIVAVEKIPTTINGKVDREALIARWRAADPARPALVGASKLELAIADRWTRVAGRPPESVSEDFLLSGGDSLRLLQLVGQLSDSTGLNLAITDVFQVRTLQSLASALLQKSRERALAQGRSDFEEELVRQLRIAHQ